MNKLRDKMKFSEIKDNKALFLECYNLKELYENSGYTWNELMEIAEKFDFDREKKYPDIIQKFITEVSSFEFIHSYRYRIKETDSFIKKLIIKANETKEKVNLSNYLLNITDLLGLRLLYVFKEDYYAVHNQIMQKYKHQLIEQVHIKLQPGDDKSLYENILSCKTIIEENNIYRSIHYTLCADENDMKGVRLEIQTRTIFEEAWSEINHKLVYKNQDIENLFVLKQASKILSALVGNCDTLAILMKQIYDEYYDRIQVTVNKSNKDNQIMSDVLYKFLMDEHV